MRCVCEMCERRMFFFFWCFDERWSCNFFFFSLLDRRDENRADFRFPPKTGYDLCRVLAMHYTN